MGLITHPHTSHNQSIKLGYHTQKVDGTKPTNFLYMEKRKRKKEPYNRQGGGRKKKKKNESYNRLGEIDH